MPAGDPWVIYLEISRYAQVAKRDGYHVDSSFTDSTIFNGKPPGCLIPVVSNLERMR